MKQVLFIGLLLLQFISYSQSTDVKDSTEKSSDKLLLTIFLKHDQSMNLHEIEKIRTDQGFYESFPPEGVSVVNWFVVMGLGQMVVLELPASKLAEVNLAIERTAWKAFKSEIYPTYNLFPIVKDKLKNNAKVSY